MDKFSPTIVIDNNDELRSALERTLRGRGQAVVGRREETAENYGTGKISIELPSDLALLEPIADYITKRIEQAWSMPADRCVSLDLALRESLINAIEHGNNSDRSKLVRIIAEVSDEEARFTVEDEGIGFNAQDVPNPSNRENLFKPSGRGVRFIRSIMDETQYNDRGNRLTMIKRRQNLLKDETC